MILQNAKCTLLLFLKVLSCLPVTLHPSQEKILDVLIVRPEVTKSCMCMFCVLVYFK